MLRAGWLKSSRKWSPTPCPDECGANATRGLPPEPGWANTGTGHQRSLSRIQSSGRLGTRPLIDHSSIPTSPAALMNADSAAANGTCMSDGIWVKMSLSSAIRRVSIFASSARPREVTKRETDRRSAPARREIIPFWTRRSHSVVVVEGVTPRERARSAGRWPARDEIKASARYCWIDNSPSSTASEFAAIATKMRLSRRRSSFRWSGRFSCGLIEPSAGGRTDSTVHTVTRTIALLKLFGYPNSSCNQTDEEGTACRTHLLPRCFLSSRQRGPRNTGGGLGGSRRSLSARWSSDWLGWGSGPMRSLPCRPRHLAPGGPWDHRGRPALRASRAPRGRPVRPAPSLTRRSSPRLHSHRLSIPPSGPYWWQGHRVRSDCSS